MRQIHHWAALLFVAAIVAHLARIFFTGAFRRPRELNWMIGVTLLVLAMVNGFAGYSLLDDQLSGTGLRVANAIILSIPIVGTWVSSLAVRRSLPGHRRSLNRLFVAHILLDPGRHRRAHRRPPRAGGPPQAHAVPGPGRREDNVVGQRLWPTYTAKAGGLFFLVASVLAALGGLAQINAIWVTGPYRRRRRQLGLAARLVHGLGRRGAAPHAAVRDPGLRLPDPQPVLPGCAAADRGVRDPVPLALHGGPPVQRPRASTTCSFRPRDHPVHTGDRRGRVRVHRRHAAGRLQRRDRGDLRALGQRRHLDAADGPPRRAADRRARSRAGCASSCSGATPSRARPRPRPGPLRRPPRLRRPSRRPPSSSPAPATSDAPFGLRLPGSGSPRPGRPKCPSNRPISAHRGCTSPG